MAARHSELLTLHQEMKEGKTPAVPLLADAPEDTQAMFVCKVLVSRKSYKKWKKTALPVNVAARVLPHLLVHFGQSLVEEAVGGEQPLVKDAAVITCNRHKPSWRGLLGCFGGKSKRQQ